MTKIKETFDTITPKMVLGQLFKSSNIMKIVQLRTGSYATRDICISYVVDMNNLVEKLAEVHFGVIKKKELDEIPAAKYIDPTMHMQDIYHYLDTHRRLFKTSHESNIIDDILILLDRTKYLLTLE